MRTRTVWSRVRVAELQPNVDEELHRNSATLPNVLYGVESFFTTQTQLRLLVEGVELEGTRLGVSPGRPLLGTLEV